MATYDLVAHPDHERGSTRSIRVYVTRIGVRSVRLTFLVAGSLRHLALAPARPAERRDDLWRTTCFEMFLELAVGYCEYNLSPSTEWAAYRFTGYRSGSTALECVVAPIIDQRGGSDWYELEATIGLPEIPDNLESAIGLTAVIEATDGTKSYWALAHAPGPPDFHNRDCFIATLPAPDAP